MNEDTSDMMSRIRLIRRDASGEMLRDDSQLRNGLVLTLSLLANGLDVLSDAHPDPNRIAGIMLCIGGAIAEISQIDTGPEGWSK